MALFLLRFWPVLLPLLAYGLWLLTVRRRAAKAGNPLPHFRGGPCYWALLASLLTGVGCFIALGAAQLGPKGHYVPPHLEHGRMMPGRTLP